MKVKELQAALKKRNLDRRGNKAVLAERLRKHAQNDSPDEKENQAVQHNNLNESTSQDLENSEEAQVEEVKENVSSTDNDQHEGNELETSERNDSFDGVGAAGIQASSTVSIDVFDASQKARSEDSMSPKCELSNSSDVSKLKTFDDQKSFMSEAASESFERNKVESEKSTEKSSQENTRRSPSQNPTEEDRSNHQTASDEVATCTLRVDNFRRPFTLKSAKSLVQEFENYVEDGFWMDKIKTHCYVTYASCDVAERTRDYLDAKVWPPENGVALKASFSSQTAAEIASGLTKSEVTPRANTIDRAHTIRKDSFFDRRREPLALDTLFMKTETKPVLYYLPAKSQQGRRQEDASSNAHKERHAKKRPFSGSYSRSHAPKMRRMQLQVEVDGSQYVIPCGGGTQTFKWLGLAVAQRHAQALYHGRYRTRNCSTQQGFYLPLLVCAAVRILLYHQRVSQCVVQKTGKVLAPSLRIADTCQDGDRITVKLQEEILVDEIGSPKLTPWTIAAFYHNCIEAGPSLSHDTAPTSSPLRRSAMPEKTDNDPMSAYTQSEVAIQGLSGRLQSAAGVEAVFLHEWRRIQIDEILEKAGVAPDSSVSSKNTSTSAKAENMAKAKEKEKLQSLLSQHFALLNAAYMHYALGCNESFYGMNGFEFAHFVHECQICDLEKDLDKLQYLIGVTLTKSDDYGSIRDRAKLSRVGFLHVLLRLLLRDYSKLHTSASTSANESPAISVVTYLETKLTNQVLPTIKRLTSGSFRDYTHQKVRIAESTSRIKLFPVCQSIVAHFLHARPTLTLLFDRMALHNPQPESQCSPHSTMSNHPVTWPRLPTAAQIKQLLYDAGLFCDGDPSIHDQVYAESIKQCVTSVENKNLGDQTLVYVEFIEVIMSTALKMLTDQRDFPPKETIKLALQTICRVQMRLALKVGTVSMAHVPDDIICKNDVFDIDFHPNQDIIGVACITGAVQIVRYAATGNQEMLHLEYHQDACRAIKFDSSGQVLLSASSDRSIRAFDTNGSAIWAELRAHDAPINRLEEVGRNIFASGDDAGCIKLWDMRQHRRIVEWKEHTDYISNFACNDAQDHILATSGDGRLSAYDLRKHTLAGKSDELEDELLSVCIIKNGRKVVCGSQDGVLVIFSWDTWGDMSDRFPGHPDSVETMLKVDEDTILTGSCDGIIRIVQIFPNKLLGLLGDHEDFPVEVIKLSPNKQLLGSVSHVNKVHFWDTTFLFEDDPQNEDAGDSMSDDDASDTNVQPEGLHNRQEMKNANEVFFSDL
uniref:Uncharacterized protein AlNc14C7G972 n=1 Tax=Albugo laibachii Nc14 TaxID=890382 RepID=F0W1M9_9STRA|nr:conserved hypothetical protein [Albugo laibachii Nc14]|eukprot:CCA14958.1 conserved hypothetical protein [Albugo laibachii Nc14]